MPRRARTPDEHRPQAGLVWSATHTSEPRLGQRQLELQDQERDAMVHQVGVMKSNEIKQARGH